MARWQKKYESRLEKQNHDLGTLIKLNSVKLSYG